MSPPSLSLSKKEPMKSTFDELPLEKGDGADSPAVITSGTFHRTGNLHMRQKRKQCRVIVCIVTLLIIIGVSAALAFTLVKYLRKHRSSWTVPTKSGQSMNVHVDHDKNLIHASHDHNNGGHVVVVEILHEYSRHLVAYKDVKNSTCYIDRLDETFEDGYARWISYEKDGRSPRPLTVISKPIEVDVVQHLGGIHIYGHCQSGNSYWVMEYEETEVTRVIQIVYA